MRQIPHDAEGLRRRGFKFLGFILAISIALLFACPQSGSVAAKTVEFLNLPAIHSELWPGLGVQGAPIALFPKHAVPDKAVFDVFISPMPQSQSPKIVFASNRDGSMQIYSMNTDGSNQARLTSSGANDDCPRWSPTGAKVLFQSDRNNPSTGNVDIYVMNADGSGVTRLTSDANDNSLAAWSSDGSKIVFQSLRDGVNYQVYSMNADGSNQVNLTNSSSSDGEPAWSPNGTQIAFASDRDHSGYASIYVMNSDGSNRHCYHVQQRQP